MSFYQELSKYYDSIFPPELDQINFIAESVKPGGRLLDVACGSGGYSAELYKRGFKVLACDLDEGMVSAAKKRFINNQMEIPVEIADMLSLSTVYKEKFDGIFCIGNSLVHLGSAEDVKRALSEMKALLAEGGSLIIQIMNFDRVKKYNIKELPGIRTEDGEIAFKRYYNNIDNGKIAFDTELHIEGKETLKNRVKLLPLGKDELSEVLTSLNFKDFCFYGDFKRGTFSDDSYVMVIKCTK